MKKILLQNGLDVSAVCLGAMNFGTTTSKQDSFEILDKFVANGGNFIDTSNNYAHWAGTGDESETVLGEWIRSRGGRDKIVLATKVGFDRHGKGAGLKKEQIEYWIDESLRKLNTDYIFFDHSVDRIIPSSADTNNENFRCCVCLIRSYFKQGCLLLHILLIYDYLVLLYIILFF